MLNQIVVCLLISIVSPIDIWLRKDNIFIKNSTYYSFQTSLDQSQQQLIPCNITFDHMIENSLATTNQYFDYFTYMSSADLMCYQNAIGNKSYLFPCPFLLNNNSKIRIPMYQNPVVENRSLIKEINKANYFFVIDNTPFPFPQGAFSYRSISISLTNYVKLSISNTYYEMGQRLIFINVTILFIYAFTLFMLICKNAQTEKKMIAPTNNQRESLMSTQKDDEESDIDNYQVIVQNEFSVRNSKDMHMPSMITSNNECSKEYKF